MAWREEINKDKRGRGGREGDGLVICNRDSWSDFEEMETFYFIKIRVK